MTAAAGRFTEGAMAEAMRDVAGRVGASVDDARLLRLTNNAVFALPAAGLVIRITRSYGLHDRVHKVVRLASWFAEVEAPTIRLVSTLEQPVRAGDLLATVWQYVAPNPPTPTVENLGPILRRFHELGTPPFPLPMWNPVADARRRLADAEALDGNERAFLHQWCDRLEPQITELNGRAGGHLVHGDAHAGNLLRNAEGRVVLCDFDATCVGPWKVDLVAVAVGELRFGRAGVHRALASAYGYNVTSDPDWPILREARELKMVAAAVPLLASAPGVAEEFRVRLESIIKADEHVQWTPFAHLRT